jgi:hypothetical protein
MAQAPSDATPIRAIVDIYQHDLYPASYFLTPELAAHQRTPLSKVDYLVVPMNSKGTLGRESGLFQFTVNHGTYSTVIHCNPPAYAWEVA